MFAESPAGGKGCTEVLQKMVLELRTEMIYYDILLAGLFILLYYLSFFIIKAAPGAPVIALHCDGSGKGLCCEAWIN